MTLNAIATLGEDIQLLLQDAPVNWEQQSRCEQILQQTERLHIA